MLSEGYGSVELKTFDYDVIIVGSGVAGLFTALHVSESLKVLLISKSELMESNSQLAQGGIAAALVETDISSHVEDTLRVGCYQNNEAAVKSMVTESASVIQKLVDLGMVFDLTADGQLHATREGGHSFSRIVHHKDTTGAELMRILSSAVRAMPSISCLEQYRVLDLILEQGRCVGILIKDPEGRIQPVTAPQVVLATGGIGELYENSTNSKIATGDGIAMSHRAGVVIKDMEYVQFHPTAFYDAHSKRRFLISEAVRGEGAYLRNEAGLRFMERFQPLMELSARDVVSREIYQQILTSQKPCVYLDLTHLDPAYIINRFPNIYAKCLEVNIDFTQDLIPVSPVQHYLMGGVVTDENGKTNITGLYACGEVASTGVHGANRLASNSLLEGLVFGRRIGLHMKRRENFQTLTPLTYDWHYAVADFPSVKNQIKQILSQAASIFRSEERLLDGRKKLENFEKILLEQNSCSDDNQDALNMVQVGLLIIEAALNRKQSLGAHQRLENGDKYDQ
jgi:L-aspartate oxidase